MPDSGKDLGADLYLLYRAGRDNLPAVAAQFATANRTVAGTHDNLAAAFRRDTHFGDPAEGPVYLAWIALRDELQRILADTSVSLGLTGDALCLAAQEYARADTVAAQEFEDLKLRNGDPVPVDVPVVQYP